MKFDHKVKHNGIWYEPFEEVPDTDAESTLISEDEVPDTDGKRTYTKSEIAKMPVDELRQLALTVGVEGAEEMNGTELKQYLLSVFGL